jgi:GNAT superfamily N-acetyltransferase
VLVSSHLPLAPVLRHYLSLQMASLPPPLPIHRLKQSYKWPPPLRPQTVVFLDVIRARSSSSETYVLIRCATWLPAHAVAVLQLPYRVRWQDLKDLFRKAGTVLRADVSLGPDNRSRGYGTVLLATSEDAARAVGASEHRRRRSPATCLAVV